MMPRPLCLALVALLPLAGFADDNSNGAVLVRTEPARQGTLPATITVYGSAAPAPNGTQIAALPFDARIIALEAAPGQHVSQGQAIAQVAPAPAAQLQIAQSRSALVQAQAADAHTRALLAQHLATLDQLDAADKTLNDAKVALAVLTAGSDLTAPADGVVSQVAGGPGTLVGAGNPVFTLTRDDGLEAVLGIEPADRPRVAAGSAVSVTALEGGANADDLRLARIADAIDGKTRLIDAAAPLPAGRFLADQPLQGEIVVGSWQGWLVPRDAVVVAQDGDSLFQVKNGHAKQVPVTLAGGDATQSIVTGAIDPALPIVISGQSQLDDGVAVRTGSP